MQAACVCDAPGPVHHGGHPPTCLVAVEGVDDQTQQLVNLRLERKGLRGHDDCPWLYEGVAP